MRPIPHPGIFLLGCAVAIVLSGCATAPEKPDYQALTGITLEAAVKRFGNPDITSSSQYIGIKIGHEFEFVLVFKKHDLRLYIDRDGIVVGAHEESTLGPKRLRKEP
jgi:hypothetical protein